MKITKENLVLVKADENKYINLEDSDYELTGNWLYSHPEGEAPYIQVQLYDGENSIYISEGKFRFTTVYRYTRNELKPTSSVVSTLEILGAVIVVIAVLALAVTGAITTLDKYIQL